MARVLYLDCFSGIAGDMLLGACLDAGMPLEPLAEALGSLTISDYEVRARQVRRCGIAAVKFDLIERDKYGEARAGEGLDAAAHSDAHLGGRFGDHAHHSHPHPAAHGGRGHGHRRLPEILGLIRQSALSPAGKAKAEGLFQRLAEAEAAVHDTPIEEVHLHEVGALDSIVDIVGAVFAFEWWAAARVVCSPLNVGGGTVRTAHGVLPVPAPATVRLLGSAPIYAGQVQKELVTPTGALLATEYADAFGPMPAMTVQHVGYGAGERDPAEAPNVLRLIVGDDQAPSGARFEPVIALECDIDDMNPQIYGVVMERLYAAGALDVYYVPIQMKKNRPGTLLTVIARPESRGALSAIIFSETTTIGLRTREMTRERLDRAIVPVTTPLGVIRFKVARRDGQVVNASPEFEDCVKLAAAHRRTVKDIQALALHCYAADAENGSPS